jgi:cytochrome c oxidase assembly factor CtaG
VLTFWPDGLYPVYAGRSELWGLSAASDQRLAGLTMWIPAGSVYVLAAVTLVGALLAPDDAPRPGQEQRTTSIVPSGSPGS